MVKIISKILRELISPGNHLIIFFVILITSLCVGFSASYFFKGNKNAQIIENYAERIIEHETGIAIDFDDSSDDVPAPDTAIIEFRYPSYEMDFKRGKQPDSALKN
jgi:hypothetical protein